MTAKVLQTDFSLGEVNQDLLGSTQQPQYFSALEKAENVYISSKKQAKKRGGLFIHSRIHLNFNIKEFKQISLVDGNGVWFIVIFYIEVEKNNVLHIICIPELNPNLHQNFYKSYDHPLGSLSDVSISVSDQYIVVANINNKPIQIEIDFVDIRKTKIEFIDFSIVPSIDDGSYNYQPYRFTPSGKPLGSTVTITNVPNSLGFTQDYVGGLVISKNGISEQTPLATGIIEKISNVANNRQIINLLVMTPFDPKAGTTTGGSWSIRKPVWGENVGYPKLCSFHGGRLFLVGTKKYPSLICGSRINTYNDFNTGEEYPTSAIAFLMQKSKGGTIKHVLSGINLNFWTESAVYIAWGGLEEGLTPKNFYPREVAHYMVNDMQPIRYKSHIYFAASKGKSLIQMTESYQQAVFKDISFASSHLVKDPVYASVSSYDNEEEIAHFLNKDHTSFLYSNDELTKVSAFSKFIVEFPYKYRIYSLSNVNNEPYFLCYSPITSLGFLLKNKSFVYLDGASEVSIKNKEAVIGFFYKKGAIVSLVQQNVSGEILYFGDFSIPEETTFKANVPDGEYIIGFKYHCFIKTMNNIGNKQNIFYKNKRYNIYVDYFDSYSFFVNGYPQATSGIYDIQRFRSSGFPMKTGVAILNDTDAVKNLLQINVYHHVPYPLNVRGIGYTVDSKVIN